MSTTPSPVPDGLADRLREVWTHGYAAAGAVGSMSWRNPLPADVRAMRDRDVERFTATVAAALASPPAAPTGEPGAGFTVKPLRDHDWTEWETGTDTVTAGPIIAVRSCRRCGWVETEERGPVAWRMPPAPSPSGETGQDEAEALARLLLTEWERVEKPLVGSSWHATFADMARAVLAAGYRRAPSGETAEPPEVLVEAPEHAPYADAYTLTPVGSGETDERVKARATILSVIQRESGRPYAVPPVALAEIIDAALAASPAQTDGEREWAVEYTRADDGVRYYCFRGRRNQAVRGFVFARRQGRGDVSVALVSRPVPPSAPWVREPCPDAGETTS